MSRLPSRRPMMSPPKPCASATGASLANTKGANRVNRRALPIPRRLTLLAAAIDLPAEVDDRATRQVDPLFDVIADQVVERRLAQQPADHARTCDLQRQRSRCRRSQRQAAAVPKLHVRIEAQFLRQLGNECAGRRQLLVGRLCHSLTRPPSVSGRSRPCWLRGSPQRPCRPPYRPKSSRVRHAPRAASPDCQRCARRSRRTDARTPGSTL